MDEDKFLNELLDFKTQNGPFILYHRNGKKSCEGNCKNGKPVGKWFFYNEDGSMKKIKEY